MWITTKYKHICDSQIVGDYTMRFLDFLKNRLLIILFTEKESIPDSFTIPFN